MAPKAFPSSSNQINTSLRAPALEFYLSKSSGNALLHSSLIAPLECPDQPDGKLIQAEHRRDGDNHAQWIGRRENGRKNSDY